MPVQFHTEKLDKKMYRRLIENIVLYLDPQPGKVKEFLDNWMVRIRPLSQTNEDFFKHTVTTGGGKLNTGIPSGVTGQYVMDLFLHDDTNLFKFRENADRIQHEICHAKLIHTPYFVRGVHDKISPQGSILKGFKIKFWTNRWKFWQYIPITIIDVRSEIERL